MLGGVKNFSVGICDGAPSTARSSYSLDPGRGDEILGLIWIQHVLTLMVFLKEYFEKVSLENKSADDRKNYSNSPSMQRVRQYCFHFRQHVPKQKQE